MEWLAMAAEVAEVSSALIVALRWARRAIGRRRRQGQGDCFRVRDSRMFPVVATVGRWHAEEMEDGPEAAEGSYEYNGAVYTLEERDSEQWRVTDPDGKYLGVLVTTYDVVDEPWPHYTCVLAGEEDTVSDATTDDWRAALEHLIGEATAD